MTPEEFLKYKKANPEEISDLFLSVQKAMEKEKYENIYEQFVLKVCSEQENNYRHGTDRSARKRIDLKILMS